MVPEKISLTKKQFICMLGFISIASDSEGFSVTKPAALVISESHLPSILRASFGAASILTVRK